MPESQTDLIFTVIGQEGGFIGALGLLGQSSLLLYRSTTVVMATHECRDKAHNRNLTVSLRWRKPRANHADLYLTPSEWAKEPDPADVTSLRGFNRPGDQKLKTSGDDQAHSYSVVAAASAKSFHKLDGIWPAVRRAIFPCNPIAKTETPRLPNRSNITDARKGFGAT